MGVAESPVTTCVSGATDVLGVDGFARSEVHRCVSTFAEKEQEMEGGMGLRLYYNGNTIYI